MPTTIKSEIKYKINNIEKLKEIMKEEGFIFKNSVVYEDDYFIDINSKLIDTESCIRIRNTNGKELKLDFDGLAKNMSNIESYTTQSLHVENVEYGNLISMLACIGYYKYVSLSVLKEKYIKKEKEYYYTMCIDKIDGVGEFLDYEIYTENNDDDNANTLFKKLEEKISNIELEKVTMKYRDYCSKAIYDNNLKGKYLSKILVELDKVFVGIDSYEDINKILRNNNTILNLELIEKLEQSGIDVQIVYSNGNAETVARIKEELNLIGYAPKFTLISQIKEIAVRETLILEKQKKIDFCQVAFIVLNNLKK